MSGIKGQMNPELDEKPGCPANSRLKPRPQLLPIPTRAGAPTPAAQRAQLRGGTFTTCGPCWRCTWDCRRACNQRRPQCRGHSTRLCYDCYSFFRTLVNDEPTKPAKTNTTHVPVSKLPTDRTTGLWRPQADPDSCSDPIPFHHENTLDQICASASRQTRGASQKETRENTRKKSFKILPQMQLNVRR